MKIARPHLQSIRPGRAGFTLIELLISVAIALILILGINQIFKASSLTASAGLAMSVSNRDNLVVKTTIDGDIKNFAPDAGIFIIRSEERMAFRNSADKLADSDGLPQTLDVTGTAPPGIVFPLTAVNNRSHRLDRLGFFARGTFTRQTADPLANPPSLTSGDTSTEAWVWYGHLALPDNDWVSNKSGGGNFYNPSDSSSGNDNNLVAADWVLGRVATLLIPPVNGARPPQDYMFTNSPTPQLEPLIYKSHNGDGYQFYLSPTDVASTSISDYLQKNLAFMLSGKVDWYDLMMGFDPSLIGSSRSEFWHAGSPYLQSQPAGKARITPGGAGFASFCMVRGCAHFIVEYAGDYLTQDNDPTSATYGQVNQPPDNAVHPDGNIDFDVFVDPSNNSIMSRKIRWYGFPRKTFDDGTANIGLHDVLPLCELMPNQSSAPFERVETYTDPTGKATSYRNFNAFRVSGKNPFARGYVYTPNWTPASEPLTSIPGAYVCAWDPTMTQLLPKMIRVTIAIDDPNGRLANPQFYEYVFNLQ
jgi:prepilin-type N-terminal cleavage/methylation domain-containing protein